MARLRKIGGSYYAYFYDRHRIPKEKSYPLRVKRKKLAEHLLHRLEEAYVLGTFDPWNPQEQPFQASTLGDMIRLFLQRNLRDSTRGVYAYVLGQLTESQSPHGLLRDLDRTRLKAFIESDPTVNPTTRRMRYRTVRAFLNWAKKEGYLDQDLLKGIRPPKEEKKLPSYLTPAQVDKLIDAIEADQQVHPQKKTEWLKDVFLVALCTGLRRGELIHLRWEDVDLDERYLVVRNRGDFKTKSGHERHVPLAGEALRILKKLHKRHTTGLVLRNPSGKALRGDALSHRFKQYVRLAGLPDHLKFHSLRHSTASWLVQQGISLYTVQAIMGHSDIRVTEGYAHLRPEGMRKAMDKVFG